MSDLQGPAALGYVPWAADPTNHGLLAWDYDPALALTNTTILTSGTVQFVSCFVSGNSPITGIALRVNTIGATLTANQNLLGLYSYVGNTLTLISATADQSTAWTSTGNKFANLTTPGTILNGVAGGIMVVGIISVGTTPPVFAGIIPGAVVNLGEVMPRFGTGASAQTALPTTVTVPSGITANNTIAPWVGLY